MGCAFTVLREVTREVLVGAEAAALDALPSHADPLAEVRDRAGSEGNVDLWVEVEDPLLLGLGEAAADCDDEIGILPLAGTGVAQIRRQLGVRLLADRAGVEDDDVGVFLGGRLTETERLEHPLDALGVVAVHLTAEGGQVVAAHRSSVGITGVSLRCRWTQNDIRSLEI